MNMTSNIFMKKICPIMALLFFFATITPTAVQAQSDNKRVNTDSLYMLLLAMAANSGQAMPAKEARRSVKEKVLIRAENVFQYIAQSGFSEKTLQTYGYMLPHGCIEKIMLVADSAKAAMSTEKKLSVIAGAFGYSCDAIMYTGVVLYVFNSFGVIPHLGYFCSLLFATSVLCYLGVI